MEMEEEKEEMLRMLKMEGSKQGQNDEENSESQTYIMGYKKTVNVLYQ